MKKLANLMSAMILVVCCITFFACDFFSDPKEELTEGEKSFVGTWILSDNISYMEWEWVHNATSVELKKTHYKYPSPLSDSFNGFCEKYIGKVFLTLDGTKIDGKMSAILYLDDKEEELKWYGGKASDSIKFTTSLSVPDYSSSFYGDTSTALMRDKKIFVCSIRNNSTTGMFFEKCD